MTNNTTKTLLAGVELPQITKAGLNQKIRALDPLSKTVLYFLYSEFVIRANSNPSYRNILNKADITAIDGKGLEWSNYILSGNPKYRPENLIKVRIYYNLLKNIWSGFRIIVGRVNLSYITKNEVILGRDFVYDLLKQANISKAKVAIIGSNRTVAKRLNKQFPDCTIMVWEAPFDGMLMTDTGRITPNTSTQSQHSFLNPENLLSEFPELIQARGFVRRLEPDLVIVCIGGASGKQEFFVDNIKMDSSINFGLAVGVGAAFDHLGSGQNQKRTIAWLERSGLEWLFRIFTNRKRARRTWHSIIALWQLTSLQPFFPKDQKINIQKIFLP
ncbi:MAG: WecB/TagA/CpsF family glycosyltransferase [Candidatus Parcubacteria bacterium]|nr:WecB/TagA/CpsF family glycosyltransferase [Candidatus Paceibacterota bacterium]